MKLPAVLTIAVLTGALGFFLGRSTAPGKRTDGDASGQHARRTERLGAEPIEDAAARRIRLQRERQEAREREASGTNAGARTTHGSDPKVEAEKASLSLTLPVGTRRKNGTIVGGAEFDQNQLTTALGFLHSYAERFFRDADLTPDQETRLRAELDRRITEAMQLGADHLNEDLTGDQVYELLGNVEKDARRTLRTVLDDKQMATYQRFEGEIKRFMNTQVVNNEIATIRRRLSLDSAQAKKVRVIVEDRWGKVQEKYGSAPIPNVFFAPVRRSQDANIHNAAAAAIREILSPEQASGFDKLEADPSAVLRPYRNLLVPKQSGAK